MRKWWFQVNKQLAKGLLMSAPESKFHLLSHPLKKGCISIDLPGPLFRTERSGFSLLVIFSFSPSFHCSVYPPPTSILAQKHYLKETQSFYCSTPLFRPVSSKNTLYFCSLPCYFVIPSRSFTQQTRVQPKILKERLRLDVVGRQRQDKIPIQRNSSLLT